MAKEFEISSEEMEWLFGPSGASFEEMGGSFEAARATGRTDAELNEAMHQQVKHTQKRDRFNQFGARAQRVELQSHIEAVNSYHRNVDRAKELRAQGDIKQAEKLEAFAEQFSGNDPNWIRIGDKVRDSEYAKYQNSQDDTIVLKRTDPISKPILVDNSTTKTIPAVDQKKLITPQNPISSIPAAEHLPNRQTLEDAAQEVFASSRLINKGNLPEQFAARVNWFKERELFPYLNKKTQSFLKDHPYNRFLHFAAAHTEHAAGNFEASQKAIKTLLSTTTNEAQAEAFSRVLPTASPRKVTTPNNPIPSAAKIPSVESASPVRKPPIHRTKTDSAAKAAVGVVEKVAPAKIEDQVARAVRGVYKNENILSLSKAAPYAAGLLIGADVVLSRDKTGPVWGAGAAFGSIFLTKGLKTPARVGVAAGVYIATRLAATLVKGALDKPHEPTFEGLPEGGFAAGMRQSKTAFGSGFRRDMAMDIVSVAKRAFKKGREIASQVGTAKTLFAVGTPKQLSKVVDVEAKTLAASAANIKPTLVLGVDKAPPTLVAAMPNIVDRRVPFTPSRDFAAWHSGQFGGGEEALRNARTSWQDQRVRTWWEKDFRPALYRGAGQEAEQHRRRIAGTWEAGLPSIPLKPPPVITREARSLGHQRQEFKLSDVNEAIESLRNERDLARRAASVVPPKAEIPDAISKQRKLKPNKVFAAQKKTKVPKIEGSWAAAHQVGDTSPSTVKAPIPGMSKTKKAVVALAVGGGMAMLGWNRAKASEQDAVYSNPSNSLYRRGHPRALEGFGHSGVSGERREVFTDFGTGWDPVRQLFRQARSIATKIIKTGEIPSIGRLEEQNYRNFLRHSEFESVLTGPKAKFAEKIGGGGFGTIERWTTEYRGQEFSFTKKIYHSVESAEVMHREADFLTDMQDYVSPTVYGRGAESFAGELHPVLYMEYIPEAKPVSKIRKTRDLLPGERQKVQSAVDEMHRRDLVHGDLNSNNVLIDQQGRPIILDPLLTRTDMELGQGFSSKEMGHFQEILRAGDDYSTNIMLSPGTRAFSPEQYVSGYTRSKTFAGGEAVHKMILAGTQMGSWEYVPQRYKKLGRNRRWGHAAEAILQRVSPEARSFVRDLSPTIDEDIAFAKKIEDTRAQKTMISVARRKAKQQVLHRRAARQAAAARNPSSGANKMQQGVSPALDGQQGIEIDWDEF